MLRRLAASLCVLLAVAVTANAGVVGVATLIANPPAVNFVTDTDYNSGVLANTWVSYALGVKTDDGSKISAIDVALAGQFNQRWTFSEDTGTFVPTPGSTNISNADSHLIPGAVVAVAASENNNTPSIHPTAADTASRDYGVGTTLAGAWGYDPAGQAAQVAGQPVNFAYIVIPKGTGPQLTLNVRGASNPEQIGGAFVLDTGDFFPDLALPPIALDAGPIVRIQGGVVNHAFQVSQGAPVTWSNLVVNGPAGATNAPVLNPDGTFSWLSNNFGAPSSWSFDATATNSAGSDVGRLTVDLIVPEPATLSLIGLAMIGFVGLARRRS